MGILSSKPETKKPETKKPETKPQTEPEIKGQLEPQSQTPATLLKKKEGKGGGFYIKSPDHLLTFTIIGTIGKKLEMRRKSGRPVKDVEEFLLNWFPVELANQLEEAGITLVQAYEHMNQKGPKVSNYTKRMSEAERLARVVAQVAGTMEPKQLFEELDRLLSSHRTEAEKILGEWLAKRGRSNKGNYIRVNDIKEK